MSFGARTLHVLPGGWPLSSVSPEATGTREMQTTPGQAPRVPRGHSEGVEGAGSPKLPACPAVTAALPPTRAG